MTNPTLPAPGQQPINVDFPVPSGGSHHLLGATQGTTKAPSIDQLDTGWLSLADYLGAVSEPTGKLRAELFQIAIQNPLYYKETYINLLDTILNLVNADQKILDNVIPFSNRNVQISTEVQSFNTDPTIQNATDALNAVIDQWNKGQITEAQLDAAAVTYNNIVDPLVSQLNTDLANYNTILPQYQAAADAAQDAAGLPRVTLSQGIPSTVPTNVSFPHPPPVSVSKLQSPITPTPVPLIYFPPTLEAIIAHQAPQFASIANSLSNVNQLVQALIAFSLQQAELNAGDPTLPNAVVQRIPKEVFQSDVGGAAIGSSVQLLGLATGSSSVTMSRVIASAAAESVYLESIQSIPKSLLEQLKLLTLGLAHHTATPTAFSAISSLADHPVSPTNSSAAFNTISGLSYASNIRDLVGSTIVTEGVNRLVNGSNELTNLTAVQKQELTRILTAVVNISLLNIALAQLAQSLQLPGLPAQILGNVSGLSNTAAAAQAGTITVMTEDPLFIIFLKVNLAEQIITQQQVPRDAAFALANAVVNQALASGPITSPEALQAAITQAATSIATNGLPVPPAPSPEAVGGPSLPANAYPAAAVAAGNTEVVNTLGKAAAAFLQTELALPFLNLPFVASRLNGVAPGGTTAAPNLVKGLSSTLVASNPQAFTAQGTPEFVQRSLNEALSRFNQSGGVLIEHFVNTLKEQGVDEATANQLANQAVTIVNAGRSSTQTFEQAAQVAVAGAASAPALPAAKAGLTAQVLQEINNNAVLGIALSNVLNPAPPAAPPVTIRDVRDSLLNELNKQNVAPQVAVAFANNITALAGPTPANDQIAPFVHRTPVITTLPVPEISESLLDHLRNILGPIFGELRAREISNTAIRTLLSTHSILSSYNEQFRILREERQSEAINAFLAQTVPAVATPNTPVFAMTNAIGGLIRSQVDIVKTYMSPAAHASLMQSIPPEEPRNFRDLDVRI